MKYLLVSLLTAVICVALLADISWHDLLTDSSEYKENVAVKAFLVNDDQEVVNFLSNGVVLNKKAAKDSISDKTLIVSIKNQGNRRAWGTLSCEVRNQTFVDVHIPNLNPNMKDFTHYTIPLGGIVVPDADSSVDLPVQWSKFNSK